MTIALKSVHDLPSTTWCTPLRAEVASPKSSSKQGPARSISLANSTRVNQATEDPIYWIIEAGLLLSYRVASKHMVNSITNKADKAINLYVHV